jgi:DNA polymerase V
MKDKYILPFTTSTVKAGFPSPAEDFVENRIDIFDKIVKHPASTFLVRAKGDSMNGSNILDGDILVVDKSLTPKNNSVIIAYIDGEFTVKRFFKKDNSIVLYPSNSEYKPIYITSDNDFLVWGVVTYVIHEY